MSHDTRKPLSPQETKKPLDKGTATGQQGFNKDSAFNKDKGTAKDKSTTQQEQKRKF